MLDRLVAARLVVADDRTAEVAHEALIREWPQLREWLDADRDALRLHRTITDAAIDWDAGRPRPVAPVPGRAPRPGEPSGSRATAAMPTSWSARSSPPRAMPRSRRQPSGRPPASGSSSAALRATEAERARADDQARSARRLKRGAAVLVGLLVVAVVLAGFSFVQVRRADEATVEAVSQADLALQREAEANDARLQAEQESRVSLSRQLAAQSAGSLDDLDVALLLSLEAGRAADTVEARGSLLTALTSEPKLQTFLAQDGPVSGLAFSPDGKTLRAGSIGHGKIVRWDLPGGQRSTEGLVSDLQGINGLSWAFSADGRLAADVTASETNAMMPINVWDVVTGERVAELPTDSWVLRVVFSPDGRTLAASEVVPTATSEDARIGLWDLKTGARIAHLEAEGTSAQSDVKAFVFSDDGAQLAVLRLDGSLVLGCGTGHVAGAPATGPV